MYFVASCVPLW
jgi:hypothetical protein